MQVDERSSLSEDMPKSSFPNLHMLESRLREEKEEEVCVDQGYVRIGQHSSSSEDMPRCAFPILVYGGASCESSPSKVQSRKVVPLYDLDRFSILPVS